MIEVVIDFKNIETQEDLVLHVREKLGLPYKNILGKWDAFIDDFRVILYKEYDKYNIEDWKNYEEYLQYTKLDAQYGIKNEQNIRDDMRLIFINFKQFYIENFNIASLFLKIIFEEIEEVNSDEWRIENMMNGVVISIS